jgi:hypothetical protein
MAAGHEVNPLFGLAPHRLRFRLLALMESGERPEQ